jgi:hypothetical protein
MNSADQPGKVYEFPRIKVTIQHWIHLDKPCYSGSSMISGFFSQHYMTITTFAGIDPLLLEEVRDIVVKEFGNSIGSQK